MKSSKLALDSHPLPSCTLSNSTALRPTFGGKNYYIVHVSQVQAPVASLVKRRKGGALKVLKMEVVVRLCECHSQSSVTCIKISSMKDHVAQYSELVQQL